MNGYEILNKLGEGSYGAAYLAETGNTKSKCVIKEIKVSHLNTKDLEDAKKEVKVLSSLLHEHITHFLDSFEQNGSLYIVMEYCAGGDLQTLITNRNGIYFPESRILDWFIQLGLAVRFIHQQHIIHRDIKTQNVFLTPKGHVKLGDFGIAKVLDKTSDLANTCIGTPYYLSPEMCENKPYSNKSDVWSVGCVLYEIVCLKHAFNAPYMKALILKIVRCTYESPPQQYSRDLKSLIKEIFQKDPKCRPSMNTILSRPCLMKRLPRFASTYETESLGNLMTKVSKQSTLKQSTKPSRIRSRIGISSPASKYSISTSHKQTPTICMPSGSCQTSKLSPKFGMFPNCSKYLRNKSNIKSSSRIHSKKSSEKQKNCGQSLNTVSHKISHSISEQISPLKQCTLIDRKPSKFKSKKKENLNNLHDQIFMQSKSNGQDKMKDLLVNVKSNLFVDLNLSKQYISNQASFTNDINFFNSNGLFSNGDKTSILEKNIHHKVKMLVTEEMIQACHNAHVSRQMAYMSEINSSQSSLKLSSSNMIKNSKDELSTSIPYKDHFNATTQQVNALSPSLTAFVPPCHSDSSKRQPKDPSHFDHLRNGFTPVNEDINYQPFSTPLLDQNNILEMKKSKVDTMNPINWINLYNGRRRWNCEPKSSIIKYFSSAKVSQSSLTTESTLLDVFNTPLPCDLQNISFNEVQNKTFNISSNKANSRITCPMISAECSPKVTELCEQKANLFSPFLSSEKHFLSESKTSSINNVSISNISKFSNQRSGVKSKSRFSSLLKKLLHHKRSQKSSVFKSLYPEFENVSNRSIIYKEGSNSNSFNEKDLEREIGELASGETVAISGLSKPLSIKEGTKKITRDKDPCSAILDLRNFSNDVFFISALNLNVNSDFSHTLKNIDISMQHQSDFNMQISNSVSPLIEKCLANDVKGKHIHSITFQVSDTLDSSMKTSQSSYFKSLLQDSSELSHLAKFPKELYFSFDQEYSLFDGSKTFSSSLILPPTYLEEIRTSIDSDDITLQSSMLTFPLIHPPVVKHLLSRSNSENESFENQEIMFTQFTGQEAPQNNDGQTVINSNSTLSDGETQDVRRLRHSLENILSCTEEASNGSHLTSNDFSDDELETSDDVHGWIEQQRITLEQQIGHHAFIEAYRCLEMAFEEKDHNMDEAILQVKTILGPSKQDFSCKIVELLVTESVYFT